MTVVFLATHAGCVAEGHGRVDAIAQPVEQQPCLLCDSFVSAASSAAISHDRGVPQSVVGLLQREDTDVRKHLVLVRSNYLKAHNSKFVAALVV